MFTASAGISAGASVFSSTGFTCGASEEAGIAGAPAEVSVFASTGAAVCGFLSSNVFSESGALSFIIKTFPMRILRVGHHSLCPEPHAGHV